MSFNVTYNINNGQYTGTATTTYQLKQIINQYNYTTTSIKLSGTAEGNLATDRSGGSLNDYYGWFEKSDLYTYGLEYADLSDLDFSGVTKSGTIFRECPNLKEVKMPDLSNYNGESITMVLLCPNVETVTGFEKLNKNYSGKMGSFFYECPSLTSMYVPINFENITQYNALFFNCRSLTELDFSLANDTAGYDSTIFQGCSSDMILYLNPDRSQTNLIRAATTNGVTIKYEIPSSGTIIKRGSTDYIVKLGANDCEMFLGSNKI